MAALIASLRALGPLRLGAMALVALASLGLVGFVAFRGADSPMALLYADLELREASQVAEQLDRARIPRQLEAGGTRVLVPADQVARARLLLAKEGLPTGGSIGYEIFDRTDGLMASSFQQAINQTRALEGELARSIRSLQGVRAARVHLVLPKREPFARDRQDAQASVVLTMAGAARMDREGTQAVLNLLGAAVPGLRPQNIAVVDSRGNVLARAGQPTSAAAASQSADEVKRAAELRLSRAVEEMLERSLGPGRVRAEASMDLDFDQVRETLERYDPDGQVVRSQQSVTANSRTTEAQPNVSVQNNLPNADAGASQAGTSEQKQDETTNYEISKTIRTLVRDQPQLRRLSVAVMVDGQAVRGQDGSATWAERTPDELARITSLVRSAIGFNEARGDRVEVVSMRFTSPDDAGDASPAGGWGGLGKADFMRMGELGFTGLLALLCLLLVVRPMVARLTLAPPSTAALPGPATPADALLGTDVAPVLRSSATRGLAELIDLHPEESAAVLRTWFLAERA